MKRLTALIPALGLVFTVACAQSDAGITTNVKTKLAADDTVKAYQVNVDTNNHVVTLSGDVNTSAAKERAVMIARQTDGVRDVIDRLVVVETVPTTGIDTGIRGDIRDRSIELKDDASEGTARAGRAVKDAGRAAQEKTAHGAAATKNAAERGVDATKNGLERGAEATKNAAEKAGKATVDTSKKIGSKIKDAVTDDNKDSDRDGK
jgi:hypothetical protein